MNMNIIENSTKNYITQRFMYTLHKERQGDLRKNKYVDQLKVDAIIEMYDKQLINLAF